MRNRLRSLTVTVGRLAVRRTIFSLTILAAIAAHSRPVFATVFAPDFASSSLDAALFASGSAGTSYSVGGGTLTLAQAAGQGDGLISVSTISTVSGDFIATVTALGLGLGRADLGLMLGTADFSSTLADVFLNDNSNTVNGNIFEPTFRGAFVPKNTDTAVLTITRTGNTIVDSFDVGLGPTVINSWTDPALSAPMNLSLFLLEAVGDTAAHQGSFTHFSVLTGADAQTAVPEPGAVWLLTCGLLALCVVNLTVRRAGQPSS